MYSGIILITWGLRKIARYFCLFSSFINRTHILSSDGQYAFQLKNSPLLPSACKSSLKFWRLAYNFAIVNINHHDSSYTSAQGRTGLSTRMLANTTRDVTRNLASTNKLQWLTTITTWVVIKRLLGYAICAIFDATYLPKTSVGSHHFSRQPVQTAGHRFWHVVAG